MGTYTEQIVFTPSEDQRWLAGVVVRPTGGPRRPVGVVCIHGAAVPFYWPTYVHVGRELARRGYLFVSGNTRGHDVAVIDAPWPLTALPEALSAFRLGGNGFGRLDEEPHDIAGWIDVLASQGAEHIVLFGHSWGVVRVLYYQAQRQDARVVGLILASGSDLLATTPQDRARVEMAERLVGEGQGDAVLPFAEGVPFYFGMESPAFVAHWERVFGSLAAEGHTPWMDSIRVPMVATLGTAEGRPQLRANVEDMHSRAMQAPRFDIQVIEGADHFYTGQERALAEVVASWLETLPGARGPGRRPWGGRRQRAP